MKRTLPAIALLAYALAEAIVLSVLLHGLTAAPLAKRYGRWMSAHGARQE